MSFDLLSSSSTATDKRKAATDAGIIDSRIGGLVVNAGKGSDDVAININSYGDAALGIPRQTLAPNTQNVNTIASTIDFTKIGKWIGYGSIAALGLWLLNIFWKSR